MDDGSPCSLTDHRLMDLILGSVAEGIFTVDDRFRITYFNPAAEEITGYSRAEVMGRCCHDVFRSSLCQQDCPLRQSIRSGRTVKGIKVDIRTRHGKAQTISVSTAPLLDRDGVFQGGVEAFHDVTELHALRKEVSGRHRFQDIISRNPAMQQIFKTLPNIAQSDATVLIRGSSGTGKELFATAIHDLSPRSAGPLITVNCGALPENLLESELFGHCEGAFTDAKKDRRGRFQAARGGTIFLDEIGDAPHAMQVKLLRVLENREVQPVGSDRSEKIDVRVVAATNQDLDQLVAAGRFRSDLYYRLNVILIRIPDLCERSEDIPLLAAHFVDRLNRRMGRKIEAVSDQALAGLTRYAFPGNVRELENVLEHAFIVSAGPQIQLGDLPPRTHVHEPAAVTAELVPPATSRRCSLTDLQREELLACLRESGWSIPRAAAKLGVHRTTVWRRMKRLGIERD